MLAMSDDFRLIPQATVDYFGKGSRPQGKSHIAKWNIAVKKQIEDKQREEEAAIAAAEAAKAAEAGSSTSAALALEVSTNLAFP